MAAFAFSTEVCSCPSQPLAYSLINIHDLQITTLSPASAMEGYKKYKTRVHSSGGVE